MHLWSAMTIITKIQPAPPTSRPSFRWNSKVFKITMSGKYEYILSERDERNLKRPVEQAVARACSNSKYYFSSGKSHNILSSYTGEWLVKTQYWTSHLS